jgi:hypothetical protein
VKDLVWTGGKPGDTMLAKLGFNWTCLLECTIRSSCTLVGRVNLPGLLCNGRFNLDMMLTDVHHMTR